MDADEREMLRASLRRLLAETDAAKAGPALAEFGWFDLLAAEPAEAVPALFEVQGEELAVSPALDAVMVAALSSALSSAEPAFLRNTSRSGGTPDAVVLPGPGAGTVPASALRGSTLHCDGFAGAGEAGPLLVPAWDGEDLVLVLVETAGGLESSPVEGIDPWLGLVRFTGHVEVAVIAEGSDAQSAWKAAVVAGRRALAHELVGLSGTMLRLATDHARERRQFGRPVGSFQAIQHRLAEARVALTAAESAVAEAWAGPEAISALLAKLWAGRAARLVGKQAQQTLAGMGFTWEHPFHRYFRRALALESILGSAPELTVELGRHLVATGEIPHLASL